MHAFEPEGDSRTRVGYIDADLIGLRNKTYAAFVELGHAPAASELGDEREVLEGWRHLHEAHALVLEQDMRSIRMANPFSAVPTAYRVHARERWWYANCAWDAFGTPRPRGLVLEAALAPSRRAGGPRKPNRGFKLHSRTFGRAAP